MLRAQLAIIGDDVDRVEAALAAAERAPVTVALGGAAAVALAHTRPALARAVRRAFADGRLRPALACAHAADATLLDEQELADELRLDEEMLQLVFGVELLRRGFAGVADAGALERAGVDYVFGDGDQPVRVGERLVMLPSCNATDGAGGEGVDFVAADAWAAELTPPWLPRAAPIAPSPSLALTALAGVTGWCVDAFGMRRVPGVTAAALVDEGWRLERFPARARLPLVRRRGLCAGTRAFVAAHELCDVLAVEARVPGLAAHATAPLPPSAWRALEALAAANDAAEPLARGRAAYEELRAFGFLGALRWRAFLSALRDTFARLAAARVEGATGRSPLDEPRPLQLV